MAVDLDSDECATLPILVKEGIHFKCALPDRMFLDSDPEFHLNLYIVISYILLCHKDYYVLIISRRLLFIFWSWFTISSGLYLYWNYFEILFDNLTNYIKNIIDIVAEKTFDTNVNIMWDIYFYVIIPAFMTGVVSILLAPLVWRKQSMSKTLLQKGNLYFFGHPFPETLTDMGRFRKSPKLSKQRPVELLLQRNMLARLQNLGKKKFWKLWWNNCVCIKGSYWLAPVRFPVAVVMVIVHSIPIFSVWANFLRSILLKIIHPSINSDGDIGSSRSVNICKALLWIPIFIMVCAGIGLVSLAIWLNLVIYGQFFVFLVIDVLRNASDTLPQSIVVSSIVVYIKMAFDNFEDDYRSLKEVVLDLCKSYSEEMLDDQEEESEVVLTDAPHEPLYVKTIVSTMELLLRGPL